ELDPSRLADQADVVFLALPHMESQRAVPMLRGQGRKVIDLSADYRLRDAALYGTWYKADHIDAVGLAEAVYGLPELHRKAIATASLVATPGCYPMGAVLATAPLIKSARSGDLLALYREFYAGEPFVRVVPEGERPTTRAVVGSNFCDVTVVSDSRTGRAVCVSALDNLGKGGSANGIQNLNIMMGWD